MQHNKTCVARKENDSVGKEKTIDLEKEKLMIGNQIDF